MTTYNYTDVSTNVNLIKTYETALPQQDDLLYYLTDNTFASGKDGYVFELGSMDISGKLNIDPSFDQLLDPSSSSLGACDAVLEFDVPLSQFQGLFSIMIDSSDNNDISSQDVLFRINTSANDEYNDLSAATALSRQLNVGSLFSDISYSEATAIYGRVNNYYTEQQVKYDFVRHLAKSITGGYSSSDIFTNEADLVQGVVDLDTTIGTTFNGVLSDMQDIGEGGDGWASNDYTTASQYGTNGVYMSMVRAAERLYNLNLQVGEWGDNTSGTSRSNELLQDISMASSVKYATDSSGNPTVGPLMIPLRFEHNDRIAVRLVYTPASATFPGNSAPMPSRAYKVFFRMDENLP